MKSMLKLSGVIVAFTALFLAACNNNSANTDGTLLRFKMKEGNTYEYAINVDLDQEIMGQKNKIVVGTSFTMEPTGAQDSSQTIKATYTRFAMKMDAGGMNMEIDTDKPLEAASTGDNLQDPLQLVQRLFTSIKGKSFTMGVDASGEVTSVSGLQDVLMAMVDSSGLPEEQRGQMVASLEDQFSEKAIKDQFATFFKAFANRQVKVGDTWDVMAETTGRMGAKFNNKYTVKEIDGKNVTLGVSSKVEGTEAEGLNGTQEGTMLVDTDLGLIKQGEINQDFKMQMQGMSMDMKGKVTMAGSVK